jgi:hypothetical protein
MLSAIVDDVWSGEQHRLGGVLFNGAVFSADVITPRLICGHWTEFRRVVAQMRRPELHPKLGIRPMAVGGVIMGSDGVVFGRRPPRAIYQQGEWQLPPAGSIDSGAARADGAVDVAAMLLTELAEEMGLEAGEVSTPRPLGIVEHAGSHVLDFGMALHTRLSAEQIRSIHAARGNQEYGELAMVPQSELAAFLAQPDVTLQARRFLEWMSSTDESFG